jgi:hypothetical protein
VELLAVVEVRVDGDHVEEEVGEFLAALGLEGVVDFGVANVVGLVL